MTVYRKLQEARVEMVRRPINKSGKNKFAGYEYYELGDFLPTAHDVFYKVGLCGNFSIFDNVASLQVFETDTGASISFQCPLIMAHNPKGQPIQDLGGTLTYYRRYLWMMALELTEGDMVDSMEPVKKKEIIDQATGEIKPPKLMEGVTVPNQKEQPWQMRVESGPNGTVEDWAIAVRDAAKLGLENVATLDDVMSIFKVNRAIFDRLKVDAPEVHAEVIQEFTLAKKSFKEIA